jgi:hypothetical protein
MIRSRTAASECGGRWFVLNEGRRQVFDHDPAIPALGTAQVRDDLGQRFRSADVAGKDDVGQTRVA